MTRPNIALAGASSTVSTPAPDATAMRILVEAQYATVEVRTRSGSQYLVVKRPGWVTVVCPDGVAAKGTHIHVLGGRMWLRDNTEHDRTLIRTSTVVSAYVLEN